jgi:hypothetical protein
MVFNVAWAESAVSGWRAGTWIHEEALRLPPDHTTGLSALRVAFAAALQGDDERARALCAGVHPGPEDGESQLLLVLTDAMLALGAGGRDFAWFSEEFARAARLDFVRSGTPGEPRVAAAYLRSCAWGMARRHGRIRERLWAALWGARLAAARP